MPPVYKARKSARARQAARDASAKKSTENNKGNYSLQIVQRVYVITPLSYHSTVKVG